MRIISNINRNKDDWLAAFYPYILTTVFVLFGTSLFPLSYSVFGYFLPFPMLYGWDILAFAAITGSTILLYFALLLFPYILSAFCSAKPSKKVIKRHFIVGSIVTAFGIYIAVCCWISDSSPSEIYEWLALSLGSFTIAFIIMTACDQTAEKVISKWQKIKLYCGKRLWIGSIFSLVFIGAYVLPLFSDDMHIGKLFWIVFTVTLTAPFMLNLYFFIKALSETSKSKQKGFQPQLPAF